MNKNKDANYRILIFYGIKLRLIIFESITPLNKHLLCKKYF